MQITIQNTGQLATFDGVLCQVWTSTNLLGLKYTVYVAGLTPIASDQSAAEVAALRQLEELAASAKIAPMARP